jgi:hypothetical protein
MGGEKEIKVNIMRHTGNAFAQTAMGVGFGRGTCLASFLLFSAHCCNGSYQIGGSIVGDLSLQVGGGDGSKR